jgi:hypothetical protein
MEPPKASTKVMWTYGAIAGICLGILLIVILQFAPPPILPVGLILASIVGFLVVGMLASKQTGQVRTGRLAGLVTGLACGIMICAYIWMQALIEVLIRGVRNFGLTDGSSWFAVLIGLAIGFGAMLGVSAGIGWV